jgi:hypothetical protein
MRTLWFALLLSSSFLLAQDNAPNTGSQHESKTSKGPVTLRGCLAKFGEDYTLARTNAEQTYELQGKGVKLSRYLGQQVEATGTMGPSLSTTAPNEASSGSASSTTLTVTSIKKIADKCPVSHFDAK